MSDPNQITFQELSDLSDLDVLGLLDEVDQPIFERGFNAATPLEQDQLRERQAQLVTRLVGELGSADSQALPADLRQRVLNAIDSENQLIAASLAPLARIGRRRRERMQRSLPHLPTSTGQPDSALQLRQVTRSAVIWRAASFALMASLLASLIAGIWISRDAQVANRLASQQSASEQLKERYVVDLDAMLLAGENQYVRGLSTKVANNGAFAVHLDKDKKKNTVELLVFGIDPGDYFIEYMKEGTRKKIGFRVDHRTTVVSFDEVPVGLAHTLASTSWSITDEDGITIAEWNPGLNA
jgi:hypothetical protein